MKSQLTIDKKSTVLLVMDCQESIVGALPSEERQRLMLVLQGALSAARNAAILVIHVVVQFREGHPEIGDRGWFKAVKDQKANVAGTSDTHICNEISPHPGDLIVTKKRMSAFTGSDLEQILRANGIYTLVLSGVSSVGVVESTARHAIDMDYEVVVLADGCADRDPQTNKAALEILLPRIATVVSTGDFAAALRR